MDPDTTELAYDLAVARLVRTGDRGRRVGRTREAYLRDRTDAVMQGEQAGVPRSRAAQALGVSVEMIDKIVRQAKAT